MNDFLLAISNNKPLVFYILLVITLFITRIPLVGMYFRSINTMIHEAGHAFTTLLFSGELIAVNLFADTSGNTITKVKSKFIQILISLSGYPASALCGLLFLRLLSKEYDLYILFILVCLTLLLMVLSIKNTYGLFWAGTFTLINLLLIYFDNKFWIDFTSTFFSLIIVVDSVISTIILLVISIKNPKKAGDAANLEKFTKIPAVLWSLMLLALSGLIAYQGIINYFPPLKGILNL